MRKITIFAISLGLTFMFFLSGVVHADTIVSSNINTDTTWTQAGSPYLITQSIDVYPNVKLTIESGVEVRLSLSSNLEIYGELIAIGTESEMIIFISDQTTPSAGDWGGIIFKEGAIGTTDDENGNYVSGSIIKYCQISYANGVINPNNIDLHILNNKILFYNSIGIENYGNSRIENNILQSSSTWCKGIINYGDSTIIGNTIKDNGSSGVINYGSSIILHNTVKNNLGGGIYNSHDNISIIYNTIIGNKTYYGAVFGGNGGGICNIGNNVTISNNQIQENQAGNSGGGIYNSGNYTVIKSNEFISNEIYGLPATGDNTGVGIFNSGNSVEIKRNQILNSTMEYPEYYGGAIYDQGTTIIESNTISNNLTSGINTSGATKIYKNIITGNTTGITCNGDVIIENNTITNSQSVGFGWGILNSAKAEINNNSITNNSRGGIYNKGEILIFQNNISNNIEGILEWGNYANIKSNNIANNGYTGISTNHSINDFENNNIYGHLSYNLRYVGYTDQIATNNYWGTTNTSEIMDHIYDYWDDITRGKVIFEPFATTPYVIRVGADKAMPWIPLLLLDD